MNLQIIKSTKGQPEYVLLPILIYSRLRQQIEKELTKSKDDYELFDAADYIENPVMLARVKKHLTQLELAEIMGVSQAYISKIENRQKVSYKLIKKVHNALNKFKDK